jgi:hypothetical protein
MAGLKMEDLADMIKEKYDLDPNAPTDWIISEYNTMLNDMGIDEKLVEDYMNGKSDELLYVSGLKEDTRWWAENKSVLWVAENVVGWAYDSATGIPRFVAQNLAKWVWWIAKKLWADEEKVQWLVDSYIESLKDFSWEAIGADTDNMLYKGTKMVWDIAQIANPAWLGKAGIKAGQVAAKIGKEWSLIAKVAKWATIWAVDTAVFMPQSEQRMATGKELAIWAAAWWVLPIAWVWLNVAKKWFAKIAPKLELSWLLNPSKLNTVKEKLIQEWVDKADALDVGKWMLDRGIKWNKEQIVSQLDNLANQSKKAVDDTLWKSTTLFKNKTADDLLDKLAQEYDWSISQAGRDKFNKIQWLIQKSKKEWLTLTELNDVKRMVWDLDPYTATGKVKVSKSDLAWANSELKKFIEKSATETIEWVDENMIKMLNNETQIARWLSEWIARKESADAVREIVNFMAGRSPWAIVWGTVGYQQGWDWKSTIIWALAWWALGSTSMKTKAANMLYKAFNKQEQTVLQKFIQSWWAEKLSPKIINKLDKVMSDIKTLVLVWWKTQSPQKWNIIRVAPTKTPPKLPTKNESISRPVVRMKAPEEVFNRKKLSPALKDMVEEIEMNWGKINNNWTVTLYHNTTPENKAKIEASWKMIGKEDWLFFSTKPDWQIKWYWEATVKVEIPLKNLELDDVFGNEAHLKIKTIAGKETPVNVIKEATSKWLNPKNESIPQMKATLKAPEEPLIAEARKYKSAEEFVEKWFTHKPPKKLYRWLTEDKSQRTELWFATLGKGLYTTMDKSFAKKFGNVIELDPTYSYPRNPLVIERPWQPASSAMRDWLLEKTGLKRISEFHTKYWEDYSVFMKSLWYDGAVIWDEVVKYWWNSDISQLKQIWEQATSKWLKPKK